MTTFQVPDQMAHTFEELARERGLDTQDYMLVALNTYLEDLEDERTVTDRLANPGRRIPFEEIESKIALED